ncbi:VRR-NUC domain [[Eubacterium] contortum]|uniref:VRR-NUC domain n=1 Tax=Faecalicatena contorta TaxID=39482 RepID=A0A174FV72_9FIRM|nr:VRR-NUC domain-containing protein [Faecalicatena contorta]MBS6764037.1 VRR-NUC domain-containing protein [Clostridium sp.]CUO52758.1 VRR-NUC domain [[Eubacterium] contortum] [Faecalicatena contorta]
MLEKDIENWLNKKVKQLGGLSFKFVSPNNPGVPDRIYIFPGGKVYFVELKTEIGKLSGIQKWQRERFTEMGCRFYLVKGMNQAKEFIKELQNEICAA